MSERTLDVDEFCACFIDWPKAFDHVNWTKLTQIRRVSGIDWQERRLLSKLYTDQNVKLKGQGGDKKSEGWKTS
jgi:hypothetical protein